MLTGVSAVLLPACVERNRIWPQYIFNAFVISTKAKIHVSKRFQERPERCFTEYIEIV